MNSGLAVDVVHVASMVFVLHSESVTTPNHIEKGVSCAMCKTCSRLWNRDTNASSNIWKAARNAILDIDRPAYLQRLVEALAQ